MSEATIKFTVDGVECTAEPGEMVLSAALRHGIDIPHYCWHPGLSIAGNCRMCLVYIKPGPPKPVVSCATEVREGMEVEVISERLEKEREAVLAGEEDAAAAGVPAWGPGDGPDGDDGPDDEEDPA